MTDRLRNALGRGSFLTAAAAATAAAAIPSRGYAASTTKPVIKIGFLDSFSGVFSDIAAYHKAGALLALEDANAKSRFRYEFVFGDDASNPATATTEMRRLVSQEDVDVLFGGTSSANGLATSALSLALGIFNMEIGPFDSAITGARATKTTYRFGPNARMLIAPLLQRVLALGRKWYFIQADYALGKDAYGQLSAALKRAGGTEVGVDVLKLGTADFSPALTKVRNSDADVLVLANSGLDAANTAKQFVELGLNKKIKLAGISMEDFYYKSLPLDALAGSTWTVLWAPDASDNAAKLARRIGSAVHGPVSARHYFGYCALATLVARIEEAGTAPEKLAAAFDDRPYDAYKSTKSVFHGYDHQNAQDVYAGAIVPAKQFDKTKFMFDLVGTVPAAQSDGTANSEWALAAKAAFASQTIGKRDGYTPK
jgi:branched-chain amino acid transport system substrate-binding protein